MFKTIMMILFYLFTLFANEIDDEIINNLDFFINYEIVEEEFIDMADEITVDELEEEDGQ